MEAKFKIGETVYITSRYDGIVKREIVSISKKREKQSNGLRLPNIVYRLNKRVQFHKDGHSVGSLKSSNKKGIWRHPCPEYFLMRIGDNIIETHPLSFDIKTNKILKIEMVNLLD